MTYLFDFDGTLVDSMPTFATLMKRILDERGISYGDDLIKIITPLGYEGTAKYYRESLGVEESEESLVACMHSYAEYAYANEIGAKPHVIEVLRELRGRGHSLNVLTASPHSMLDPCLKRLDIYGLFDNVWSCEDFGTTKSDPKIYLMAAQKMGVSVDEVIFLDDNFNADRVAKSAGMTVYAVYDESSAEYEREMREAMDRYILDFSELL